MPNDPPRLLVTAAGGQLGQLVIRRLLDLVAPGQIVATVRGKGGDHLSELGVQVRLADYDRPDTLDAALAGVDRVLLVSSTALGRRVAQHRNVIEVAKRAGVGLLAYTSVLHADASPLGLAEEHRRTEALLRDSGVPYVVLRNGWYAENHTAGLPGAVARGLLVGGSGEGRIASAARADYAAAAAAVLAAQEGQWAGRTLELAGDDAYTLAELAAEAARQSGRPVAYRDLPEAEHRAALLGAGLPEELAGLIADSDAHAAKGALFDGSRQLSALIGRPTTPMAASVREVLARA